MKQGFVNPDTGLVYWSRQASCKDGIRWITPEEFQKKREQIRQWRVSDRGRTMTKISRNTDEKRALRNEYAKTWRTSEEQKKKRAEYARKRRATNHIACLSDRLRARVREAFRVNGYKVGSSTEQMIGCSWESLVAHIESRFLAGMTWENRGDWHIDHIIPLSSAKNEAELLALCHYTNLQPLWASENQRKGGRIMDAHIK